MILHMVDGTVLREWRKYRDVNLDDDFDVASAGEPQDRITFPGSKAKRAEAQEALEAKRNFIAFTRCFAHDVMCWPFDPSEDVYQ